MRWLISATAFTVPLLAMIAIGGTCADPAAAAARRTPAIGRPALDELHRYVASHATTLDAYAMPVGAGESEHMPHLALERFDRRGSDAAGQPWFRLARDVPPACGVLRRDARGEAIVIRGSTPDLLVPLSGNWWYWEIGPAAPTGP